MTWLVSDLTIRPEHSQEGNNQQAEQKETYSFGSGSYPSTKRK